MARVWPSFRGEDRVLFAGISYTPFKFSPLGAKEGFFDLICDDESGSDLLVAVRDA